MLQENPENLYHHPYPETRHIEKKRVRDHKTHGQILKFKTHSQLPDFNKTLRQLVTHLQLLTNGQTQLMTVDSSEQ